MNRSKETGKMEKSNSHPHYLVKRRDECGSKEQIILFHEYPESRHAALEIVKKMNFAKSSKPRMEEQEDRIRMKEVYPDIWTDGNTRISIEIMFPSDPHASNKRAEKTEAVFEVVKKIALSEKRRPVTRKKNMAENEIVLVM
jgi:hypothetical protein